MELNGRPGRAPRTTWLAVAVVALGLPLRGQCQGPVLALCPDIGETAAVFTTRDGGGGLAQGLLGAGYRVELVDPWSGDAATERGFDAVLEEVYPYLLARAAVDGSEVIWIGRGVCGLLPVAAAATGQAGEIDAWISLGTRFDHRFLADSYVAWLRAWAGGEPPLEDVERRALLTGLAPSREARRRGSTLRDVENLWRTRVATAPPTAVVEDILRWYEAGSCTRRSDDLDYLAGLEETGLRALMVAAVTDPLAPPEDVIAGLDRARGDVRGDARGVARGEVAYRMLSRVNGHGEEFGHVGMMLSRASRHGVQPVVLAWLAGKRRLP